MCDIARNYYILMLCDINWCFFFAGKLKKLQLIKIDQNRLLCLTPAIGGCVAYWFASLMGGVENVWQVGRQNNFFFMQWKEGKE